MAKKTSKKKERPLVLIRKLRTNYELSYGFDKRLTAFIKTFPREHHSVKVNTFIGTDGTQQKDWFRIIRDIQIGRIISFLKDNEYDFRFLNLTKKEGENIINEYKERQKRIRQAIAFKNNNFNVSNEDYSFMKIPPYDYQKKAIKFFEINNGLAILGDQPGVGKSLSAFAYSTKHNLKTLVICPAGLKLMWRDVVMEFADQKAHVFKYKPTKRSGKINYSKDESLFHVLNFDSIKTYIKMEYKHVCNGFTIDPIKGGNRRCGTEIIDLKKSHKKCPECGSLKTMKSRTQGIKFFQDKDGSYVNPDDYDCIIIDEFHRMKDPKTEWTQLITQGLFEIPRKLLLSGTAIKSKPIELFVPLSFLNKKEWNSRHEYAKAYCAAYEDNFGWDYDGASNLDQLFERISPFYLRRLKKDVLEELPPKTYTEMLVDMTTTERSKYNKLELSTKTVVNALGEEKEIEKSFMEKTHELKMFTESLKLNQIKEFIWDIIDADEKVVLFFDYIETANKVKEIFGDDVVIHTGKQSDTQKHEAVKRFQEDKNINVFGATIMSAGVGLTLTAANKLIFIGQAWTSADMEQAEDRIHRASTTHDNIQIITVLIEDTIDIYIYDFLKGKAQVVSKVLDNQDYSKQSTRVNITLMDVLKEKLLG